MVVLVVVWSDAILFFLLLNRFSRIQSYLEYKMTMLMKLRIEKTERKAINQWTPFSFPFLVIQLGFPASSMSIIL